MEDDDSQDDDDQAEGVYEDQDNGGDLTAHPALHQFGSDNSTMAIPKCARFRMNLAALSQRYNMYIVAYQEKIHVYVPKNAPEILTEPPALVLRPPPSEFAPHCYQSLNATFSHQINNLIVGDLGSHEVLLVAYDDGDVIAYYTATLARYIQRVVQPWNSESFSRSKTPKPFFKKTVGCTAWGLALHQQSRLIAVSSNLREITVFAFALKQRPNTPVLTRRSIVPTPDNSPHTCCGLTACELEYELRKRDRDWRILLPLGMEGHNIPTICFWSDRDGNADKIVASDVNNQTWILDIWSVGSRPVHIPSGSFDQPGNETGWGLAVLSTKTFHFVEADSDYALLGMRYHPRIEGHDSKTGSSWLDTTDSLQDVPDDIGKSYEPKVPRVSPDQWPPSQDRQNSNEKDEDQLPLDPTIPTSENRNWDAIEHQRHLNHVSKFEHLRIMHVPLKPEQEILDGCKGEMIICPSTGSTWAQALLDQYQFAAVLKMNNASRLAPRREHLSRQKISEYGAVEEKDLSDIYILRTFEQRVDLIPASPDEWLIISKNVLVPRNRIGGDSRITAVLPVPELGLVVAGSQNGRVALLRMTKARPGLMQLLGASDDCYVRHGFRVEWLLPRKSDEKITPVPRASLHGVSISPWPGMVDVGPSPSRRKGKTRATPAYTAGMKQTSMPTTRCTSPHIPFEPSILLTQTVTDARNSREAAIALQ